MKVKNPANNLKEKINLNQTDLGVIIMVTSLTVLIFSTATLFTLQDTNETLQQVESNYTQINTAIDTENFQQGLEDLETEQISDEAVRSTLILSNALQSTTELTQAQQEVEQTQENYQWLILLSILGIIAGITTIYV